MEKFSDWFDPYDFNHISAFSYLRDTGHWPEGFIPDNIDMGNIWQFDVVAKIAAAWVDHMMEKRI